MKKPSPEEISKVVERLRQDDVLDLALTLGNIDSPAGREREAGEFIFSWLKERELEPRKVGLLPERFNVVGRLRGTGEGPTLVFNSHMDTSIGADETWSTVHAADRIHHAAWREGEFIYGNGVCNDKGAMAAWMTACETIRQSGIRLAGDVLLTMVVGEIGLEPVDEYPAPAYLAKEFGTRYVLNRGFVGDFALVAEGTDFRVGWTEAGKAFFKIRIFGEEPPVYTPYVTRASSLSPNAIVRMVPVIQRIEEWAKEYESSNRYESRGGIVEPRVSIGAIRGGLPYKITKTSQVCAIYVDVRLTPAQRPEEVRREVIRVLNSTGVPFDVELYTYRRAYDGVRGQGSQKENEPLLRAVAAAHRAMFGKEPEPCLPQHTSMWRDINVFHEAGIPGLMYGPGASLLEGRLALRAEDLIRAAKLYTWVALEACGVAE
ncbi:MAG: M20/M25/M40 family metallo-hydrolase [Deltaproteobacteria bacterium]|nr:M20/M25/M40 family metallo-hydrolase [Deltaproteobacteria bacterium]